MQNPGVFARESAHMMCVRWVCWGWAHGSKESYEPVVGRDRINLELVPGKQAIAHVWGAVSSPPAVE
eukprot:8679951-Alexandrium_andersonii.AAC.1